MDIEEIRQLFDMVKKATTEPAKVAQLCERYLSENTPTNDLSIMEATVDPYNLLPYLKDGESGLPLIRQLAEGLTSLLYERGYRGSIKTHQEHRLIGSSGSGTNTNENEFPYTVVGILTNQISVEEARKARELEWIKGGAVGTHWGIDGIHNFLLPEIDDKGVTVKDPVLVDSKGNILAEKLVDGAPYKR